MCFGGFHPAKNVEVPPTPVGGAPPGIPAKDAIGKHIFEVFPDNEQTRRSVEVYREVLKTQQRRILKKMIYADTSSDFSKLKCEREK
jgi:hypothetical protein